MDLLQSHEPETVTKNLELFVLEARKINDQHYPPTHNCALLCGLHHVMQDNKTPFNFFDKGDQCFRELHLTLDTISMNRMHQNRIRAARNSVQIIVAKDEEVFWDKGCLSTSSTVVLQCKAFFYTGLHFVLCEIQE